MLLRELKQYYMGNVVAAKAIYEYFKFMGTRFKESTRVEIVEEDALAIYDENYYNEYMLGTLHVPFDLHVKGEYNNLTGMYRTKDGKYLLEVIVRVPQVICAK